MAGGSTAEARRKARRPPRSFSFAALRARGMSRRTIRRRVAEGEYVRVRRDVYVERGESEDILRAARVGGRLDCVSAMRERGVFVRERGGLHIQVDPRSGRLASPEDRKQCLAAVHGVVVHWRDDPAPDHDLLADPVASAARAVRCQHPRDAVATIDSALHLGVIRADQIDALFALLPARCAALRPLIDGRAESGAESLARLALRVLGRSIDLQVRIDGVGRVDLLVDGWIVVECDGKAFHESWAAQLEDRRRDLALAARGYACVRVTAMTVFEERHVLVAAVRGLLRARR
ncbi:hypothetical protein GCM10017576_20200 [Microbacterium barkeri]|uniref:DUF559 domain-containing protein n=1 Tax=Microbacterium barkeri TaxID=33917 RepID=A0A9W6H3L2_9MICO|nr:type IV toxin-antitoxin system AbiEi family antitoxin domain-containing protein [Microbacterium barkeri]MDR6876967.1 very-short-patch-repair endonuclease [Microbacterium barkeri]GLJ61890.1 hypothetical protein GCM10017576_20200 [Microbacterium barkeri]